LSKIKHIAINEEDLLKKFENKEPVMFWWKDAETEAEEGWTIYQLSLVVQRLEP
jgi:hypothetical protein